MDKSQSWEIYTNDELKIEMNKLKNQNIKLNKKLTKITKLLIENQKQFKMFFLESKTHSKNIRDIIEIFSDIKGADVAKDPITESRMHNRMWRHTIKNHDNVLLEKVMENKGELNSIYKNFNSK